MRHIIGFCLLASGLAWATPSAADTHPWGFVDLNASSIGVEGGTSFGNGVVRPGFSVGVRHPYDLTLGRPDFEGFAGVTIIPAPGSWFFSPNIGMGLTYNGDHLVPSLRGLLVFMQTTPIAFRASLFVLWNGETHSGLAKLSIGPSIRLGDTRFRIFPNIGLLLSSPGTARSLDVSLIPGVTLFF